MLHVHPAGMFVDKEFLDAFFLSSPLQFSCP